MYLKRLVWCRNNFPLKLRRTHFQFFRTMTVSLFWRAFVKEILGESFCLESNWNRIIIIDIQTVNYPDYHNFHSNFQSTNHISVRRLFLLLSTNQIHACQQSLTFLSRLLWSWVSWSSRETQKLFTAGRNSNTLSMIYKHRSISIIW